MDLGIVCWWQLTSQKETQPDIMQSKESQWSSPAKKVKPESGLSSSNWISVLENAEDRGMWNCNVAMQLANPDNGKTFLQRINCKEKIERERKREMAGESMN